MSITHAASKTSGELGYASEWNADHVVTDPDTAKRTATFIVAASDSEDKERADYVCDGTADGAEIQQAHDALPAAGGRILLLEGTFNFHQAAGGAYVTVTKDNVTIQGQGKGTLITWQADAITFPTALFLNPAQNFTLADVRCAVSGAGNSWLFLAANGSHSFELRNIHATGTELRIETASTCNYMRIFNLLIENSPAYVDLNAGTRCEFQKVRAMNADVDFFNGFIKSMVCNNNVDHLHLNAGANTNMVHDNITNTLVNAGTGNDLQDNVTGW